MKITLQLLLLILLVFVSAAQADEPKDTAINTDLLLEQYIRSWSTVDPEQRLTLLKTIWTEAGVHESPYGRSEGITAIHQEIQGFLQMFPGARVAFEDIKQTGNQIVCTFILRNTDGGLVMTGTDYFEFNEAGKLLKVVGFVAKP